MQTWKTREIPEHWKISQQSIKRLNPDWQYVLMTDEDNERFVRNNFPGYLELYLSYPNDIQRADMIRPMWLYLHGGVYIDLDYKATRPLDGLFVSDTGKDTVYLCKSSNYKGFTNSFMASTVHNPFWLEYIQEIARRGVSKTGIQYISVMYSTGPATLTHVAETSRSNIVVLPSELVNKCSMCNLTCKEEDKTGYFKQLQGSSWHDGTSKAITWCWCNMYYILLLVTVVALASWMAQSASRRG